MLLLYDTKRHTQSKQCRMCGVVRDLGVWTSGERMIVDCERPLLAHEVLEQHIVVGIQSRGSHVEGLYEKHMYAKHVMNKKAIRDQFSLNVQWNL